MRADVALSYRELCILYSFKKEREKFFFFKFKSNIDKKTHKKKVQY